MAYDERLAARIRELLAGEDAITEQAMFGGLAFLAGGHMAVAASGQDGILVRVAPEDAGQLLGDGAVIRMVMGGKELAGWLRVAPDAVRTDGQLEPWVRRSLAHVRTLPPKGSSKAPRRRPAG